MKVFFFLLGLQFFGLCLVFVERGVKICLDIVSCCEVYIDLEIYCDVYVFVRSCGLLVIYVIGVRDVRVYDLWG